MLTALSILLVVPDPELHSQLVGNNQDEAVKEVGYDVYKQQEGVRGRLASQFVREIEPLEGRHADP